jgi:hypothetical protein
MKRQLQDQSRSRPDAGFVMIVINLPLAFTVVLFKNCNSLP